MSSKVNLVILFVILYIIFLFSVYIYFYVLRLGNDMFSHMYWRGINQVTLIDGNRITVRYNDGNESTYIPENTTTFLNSI